MRIVLRLVLVGVAFICTMLILVRLSEFDSGKSGHPAGRRARAARVSRHVSDELEIQLQSPSGAENRNSTKQKLQYVTQVWVISRYRVNISLGHVIYSFRYT